MIRKRREEEMIEEKREEIRRLEAVLDEYNADCDEILERLDLRLEKEKNII